MISRLLILSIFVFLCVKVLNASSTRNVALRRPIYPPCGQDLVHDNFLTDDSMDDGSIVLMETNCPNRDLIRLVVTLPPTKMIGSVVLFAGACDDCDRLLDNFKVELTPEVDPSEKILCGHYISGFMSPGIPMRVNCDVSITWNKTMIEVTIYPAFDHLDENKKASIAEIEVNLMEYSQDRGYYGCYTDFNSQFSTTTFDGPCQMKCFENGFRFMTLRHDGSCHCTSEVPTNILDDERCPTLCTKEKNMMCGSLSTYSVYVARAPHIYAVGCYGAKIPEYAKENYEMTVSTCLKECAKMDKVYAFVQNRRFCYCEDEPPEEDMMHGAGSCSCSGLSIGCGTPLSALVFTGCIDKAHQGSCEDVYKCREGKFDEFGICHDLCQVGWIGTYCLARNLILPIPIDNDQSDSPTVSQSDSIRRTRPLPDASTAMVQKVSEEGHQAKFTNAGRDLAAKVQTEKSKATDKGKTIRVLPGGSLTPPIMDETCQEALEVIKKKYLTEVPEYLPPSSEKVEEYADELVYEWELRFPLEVVMLMFMVVVVVSTGIGISYGYFLAKEQVRRKTFAFLSSRSAFR